MKPTSLDGVGSHAIAIQRGWVKPAGVDSQIEYPSLDMLNDTGDDLLEGQVVVVLDDGTIATTTTVSDPRPTGIVLDDIADGDSGPVQFLGPVDFIRVTAAVTAGNFGQTSATAGAVEESIDPDGAFVYFTSSGTEPEGFLWRPGAIGGVGGGGSSDEFLLRDGGEQHAVSTTIASGSTLTLDLSSANIFDITLTDDCTLSFSSPPDSGVLGEWTIILRQDSTGSRTITWPAEVEWQDTDGTSGASAPTLFTAATAENVIVITTLNGGTSYGGGTELPTSGTSASDTNIWRPVLDGSGLVIADGSGQAVMAYGPA